MRSGRKLLSEGVQMKKSLHVVTLILLCATVCFSPSSAQDKKLEKIRIGGGSVGAPQMTMWFAKEANFYEKHGLSIEAISIPGSSMALQAMLSGEVPIIQLGGTASMQANLAGADTVIVATILKKFLFSIFSRPEITRIADLKGKLFGATRFGTLSDFASRFALEKNGLNPERDITMVQTGGQPCSPAKCKRPPSRCRQRCAPGKRTCVSFWTWLN